MSAELMLECTTVSLLIIEKRKNNDIVIGVPHHAPAGVTNLPCPIHDSSDENTGFLGRYVAEKLDTHSVIACNYPLDVNKCLGSDYTVQISKWKPHYLVEIHGWGKTKPNKNYDIEISSGKKHKDFSENFANKLQVDLSKKYDLNLKINGKYDEINLKASNAVTINDGNWIPIHIELPNKLRKLTNKTVGKPPDKGYRFCDCLIEALNEICRK